MTTGTAVRTVVLIVALINQGLAIAGYSPLPFEEQEVEQFVSLLITVGASLVAWFKDNSITKKAQQRDEFLKAKGLK